MDTVTASFKVTIGRETRWIEARSYSYENFGVYNNGQDRFSSVAPIALARVGRTGSKLWPSSITIWRDKKPDANGVYGYHASMGTVHLNRQAVIVEWNRPELDKYLSHHSSSYDMPTEAKCAVTGSKA